VFDKVRIDDRVNEVVIYRIIDVRVLIIVAPGTCFRLRYLRLAIVVS
jgi:hypothetical protein